MATMPPTSPQPTRPWWRRWWAWLVVLPLLLVLGGCATVFVAVNVSARRSADDELARMEDSGVPKDLRQLGTVVEDRRIRGAVLEGDQTRIVIVVEAPGSPTHVQRQLEQVLERHGLEPLDSDGRFQYFSRDVPGSYLTAATEVVGPGEDLRGDDSDRRAPPGTSAVLVELS